MDEMQKDKVAIKIQGALIVALKDQRNKSLDLLAQTQAQLETVRKLFEAAKLERDRLAHELANIKNAATPVAPPGE